MDTTQILVTAAAGLTASVVTAIVTNILTRAQERRKHERDVAARLSELNSKESSVTQVMATQYAQACLVVEHEGEVERDRVFIPVGCRITLGSGAENHIVVDHKALSKQHVAFRALGSTTYLEPLNPRSGVVINGNNISESTKLSNGDVVSVPGSSLKLTFVALRS